MAMCRWREIGAFGADRDGDGAPAFAELGAREPRRHELAADWLFRPGWNMVRLTGRGLEGHAEAFSVQVLPDAVVIRFR